MVKMSAKKSSKKVFKKHKTKKTIHKRAGSKQSADFLKKYPGLTVAIIFGIIVLVAYAYIAVENTINQRSADAEELSQMIRSSIDYTLYDIELTMNEPLEGVLDDDYLLSEKDTIEWLKKTEEEAYNSHPLRDVEYKEIAILLFINFIGEEVEGMTNYDFGTPDMEAEIIQAMTNQFDNPDVISKILEELPYSAEEIPYSTVEKEKIKTYFNKLFDEYVKNKRFILESSYSQERKYVEAKKINYIGIIDSE